MYVCMKSLRGWVMCVCTHEIGERVGGVCVSMKSVRG